VKNPFRTLLFIGAACLLSAQVSAQQSLTVEYQFSGDAGVNLGTITGGVLTVAEFQDHRQDAGANDISAVGRDTLTLANQSVSELVQSALESAFTASGARLSEDASLRLEGVLLDMKIQESAAGGLELLIRSELRLRNQGRSAWQSVVQSRTPIAAESITDVLGNGLDRLIRSLFMDDYFLMELGIF
jgi:hypothetical protein